MRTTYYSNARSGSLTTIEKPRSGSWLHVVAPSGKELATLSKELELDHDLLTDGIDLYEAPRIEREGEAIYIYTRYYHADNGVINATEPLLIVYRPDCILTLLRIKSAVLEPLTSGREVVITTQKTKTLLQMLEEVNNSYRRYLIGVNRQLLSVRSQLKRDTLGKDVLVNFVHTEDDLNEFLSALQPQAAMLRGLLNARYLRLYEEDRDLVEDLSLGTNELIELVKSRQKTIANIRQAYDAIAASELNLTFRRLTTISIFLMIPTILSGLFGMNVALPFSQDGLAFWYVIGLVVLICSTTFAVFKLKRWI